MIFFSNAKENELRGNQGKPSKVIISNSMTELLKNGHQGVVSQLCSLDVQTSIPYTPLYLQIVINNNPRYLVKFLRVFHLLEIMTMLFI
jgi:hypothetical protein